MFPVFAGEARSGLSDNRRMAGKTTTEAANHLRAWREWTGEQRGKEMTQVELAILVGVHSSVISELESGRKQLSDKWLRRLGPAFGMEPGFLLFDPYDANTEIMLAARQVDPAEAGRVAEVLRAFRLRA